MRTGLTPARIGPLAYVAVILLGTGLLSLPWSTTSGHPPRFSESLFTSTSAVSVTGLNVVDTATYWSPFGQVVILVLIQIGGFGIMTFATLLGLLVARRLGLQSRMVAQAETRTLNIGDVREVLKRIAVMALVIESVTFVLLTARLRLAYDDSLANAAWHGLFHAVSAFNSGGFALYSDGMTRFVDDGWICGPVVLAALLGSIGFPVLIEIVRQTGRPSLWSVHTKITLAGSGLLLTVGTLFYLIAEWNNARTMGPLDVPGKIVASIFHATMPRSTGLNTIDVGSLNQETLAFTDGLMFIGGGSASTAGGIKVSTFFVLFFVILAEVRGERDVVAFGRRISADAQRLALTVALLGVGLIAGGTVAMLMVSDYSLDQTLFETISAAMTVGLSTGITPHLPEPALFVLSALMFVGRVGPITVASALALRGRDRRYRYPEERPIVG